MRGDLGALLLLVAAVCLPAAERTGIAVDLAGWVAKPSGSTDRVAPGSGDPDSAGTSLCGLVVVRIEPATFGWPAIGLGAMFGWSSDGENADIAANASWVSATWGWSPDPGGRLLLAGGMAAHAGNIQVETRGPPSDEREYTDVTPAIALAARWRFAERWTAAGELHAGGTSERRLGSAQVDLRWAANARWSVFAGWRGYTMAIGPDGETRLALHGLLVGLGYDF